MLQRPSLRLPARLPQVLDDYVSQPQLTSQLPLKHAFFLPDASRFVECYYWDSYWVVLALLRLGCYHAVEGVVRNLLELIDVWGHVPNGSRAYYINRR